ncbi:MAG: GAF domain-containing protein [Candidatus Rokubacteria bacterium]|nr:GAF domain-containing protein [Candidatus Rokubacteria bacterium]
MTRRDPRFGLLVAASVAVLLGLGAGLLADVGRPYPGFFFSPDYRIFPEDPAATGAGLAWGDRIVAVDGGSPIHLMARVRASDAPVRYEVERDGRRFETALAPATFTLPLLLHRFAGFFAVSAAMLGAGLFVYAQNPAARPNQNFLIYMCLWAVSNVAVPEAVLAPDKYGAYLLGFLPPLLAVHGWVFFLTYPVNPPREIWLERHRVIPRLYQGAFVVGAALTAVFVGVRFIRPEWLATGWLYGAAAAFQGALSLVSFPIKIGALLDTRRRAASPLVNQQTTVLLLGIALGLGCWITLMLTPLQHQWNLPVDPQVGSILTLIYPLSIGYATVRYRLFDASVALRQSVLYTLLAGLITATYALAIAGANVVLAQSDLTRSPWFGAAFMFLVALVFHPVRERLRRVVDRTFFRERYDHVRTIQALSRSLRSLLDLEDITRRLAGTIESAMHVRRAELLLGSAMPAPVAAALGEVPGALSRYQVAADPRFAATAPGTLEAYAALGAEVVVPLRFQDALRGALALGAKRSEAPYTAEDLELLETLGDQAAVAVANAEAHRQVLDYARELERNLLIRNTLVKFVPQRVRELVEASPEAPSLDKREADVTVLFVDISGYTRLSARLAPDALDRLVERYFGAFLDEIVKHGGDVNETAGDGLMVIFHEGEHPRQALEAGRAIQRRAGELGAELAGRFDPLAIHVGINTGPALLGATKIEGGAGTRWTYTASGLTTNLAARLAAAARGGEVVLSESTLERVGAAVEAEDLGLRELKNIERPVRLFRLQ